MNTLNFDTGLVDFSVNGKCEVSFNPTDTAFVEKMFNVFETLDKTQEAYKDEVAKMADQRKVFEIARSRDAEMREILDGLFGASVCASVFGEMNVYAMAGGLPVWCNFLLAVIDEVDTTFAREQKQTNPRIAKYTAKYQKK